MQFQSEIFYFILWQTNHFQSVIYQYFGGKTFLNVKAVKNDKENVDSSLDEETKSTQSELLNGNSENLLESDIEKSN